MICQTKNRPSLRMQSGRLRGFTRGQGFEPQISDPESDVLPIKLSPIDGDILPRSASSRKFWRVVDS